MYSTAKGAKKNVHVIHLHSSSGQGNAWCTNRIQIHFNNRTFYLRLYLLTSYLVPLRLAVMPCFFLRFFLGAGSGFFSSDSTLRFSSGAAGRALCNREDCVAPGLRAYCVKDVKVTSERFNSLVLQRFDYFFFNPVSAKFQ